MNTSRLTLSFLGLALSLVACTGTNPSYVSPPINCEAPTPAQKAVWCTPMVDPNTPVTAAHDLMATKVTDVGFDLVWQLGTGNESYTVEVALSGSNNFLLASTSLDAATTTVNVSGLVPATTYDVRVVASKADVHVPSAVIKVTTFASVPPKQVATPRFVKGAADGNDYLCMPADGSVLAYSLLSGNSANLLSNLPIPSNCDIAPTKDVVLFVGNGFSAGSVDISGYGAYDKSGAATESFPNATVNTVYRIANVFTNVVVANASRGEVAVMTWKASDHSLTFVAPALNSAGTTTNDGTARVR